MPSATLTDIVEPWFLGGGADGPGGAEFAAFKAEHEGKVRFHASISDMPKPDGNMMAMVCTRRPAVLRRLHAIDARRLHERRSWVVSFSILSRFAQVCTRTADMPGYVDELVDHGVSHVFLEKPGAPTVEELGRMKDDCAAKGATIWMVRAAAWKWRLPETAPPRRRQRRPFRAGLQQERDGLRHEGKRSVGQGARRRLYVGPPQRVQSE